MQKKEYGDKPGYGVAYWEDQEQRVKKDGTPNDRHPDFKGYLILEMDYKAGDKLKLDMWQKKTYRDTPLLSIKEDNFTKKLRETPREDRQGYQKQDNRYYRPKDDNEVPF